MSETHHPSGAAVLDIDLFSEEALADSAPVHKQLRDAGDAVWVPRLDMFVLTRFDEVAKAARAADKLISGQGVSVNAMLNGESAPLAISTITTDGPDHNAYKRALMKPLTPASMEDARTSLDIEAERAVVKCANGESFDAMSELSSHLPLNVVSDLVGLKNIDGNQMLEWSMGIFDAFGPLESERTQSAFPRVQGFIEYVGQFGRDNVADEGWADQLLTAGENDELPLEAAKSLVFDYVVPSLDTTICSTGEMLYRLATTPGAFDAVRNDPSLIPGVINESVRLATPLRGFTRHVNEDFALSETVLPAGSRVFLVYAAANRDERHYDNPETFDVTRNPTDHLGWGLGTHFCAGVHLARAEMSAMLNALIKHVESIEIGTPTRLINNSAQGFETLPMTLHPKGA